MGDMAPVKVLTDRIEEISRIVGRVAWGIGTMVAQIAVFGFVVGIFSVWIADGGVLANFLSSQEGGEIRPVLIEHRSAADAMEAARANGFLPDSALTPGDTVSVDQSVLCRRGYAASVRDVPREVRNAVFGEYGIAWRQRHDYEIDHLIPLSIGGSNNIANLWAQSRETLPWNAGIKDTLEDVLHKLVCSGKVPLVEAQEAMRWNWMAAYRNYVGPELIPFVPASERPEAPGDR